MNFFYRIIYFIGKPFFCLLFPFRVLGAESIPAGGAVLCANHVSAVDPLMVAAALPRRACPRFMGKAELFEKPFAAWFLRKAGVFPVQRGRADLSAMKTALKCLQSGEKLVIFPEGTRVEEAGDASAKTGAVMLASRTGVPIVPVYCGEKRKFLRRTTIVFGTPYQPQFAGRRPTAEEQHRCAEELLEKIYRLKEAM